MIVTSQEPIGPNYVLISPSYVSFLLMPPQLSMTPVLISPSYVSFPLMPPQLSITVPVPSQDKVQRGGTLSIQVIRVIMIYLHVRKTVPNAQPIVEKDIGILPDIKFSGVIFCWRENFGSTIFVDKIFRW